jgi:hypothetical protein
MRNYLWAIIFLFPLSISAALGQVIGDDWYIVHVGKMKWGYYNEKVEKEDGTDRLRFQQHYWKLEEGFINEEHLGAISKDDPELTPVLFNFHANYRSSETSIDGSVQDSRVLVVKIKKAGNELPLIKKGIPRKVFFSVFFPYWLQQNMSKIRTGKSITFNTILEDNIDMGFSVVPGTAKMNAPDAIAKKNNFTKILVKYRGLESLWWVDSSGIIQRAEMPKQNVVVEKSSEKIAKRFLEDKK